jgi:hypothetical protein
MAIVCFVTLFAVACGDSIQTGTDEGAGDVGDDSTENLWTIAWVGADTLQTTAAPGEVINITAVALHNGVAVAGTVVKFDIMAGGGTLSVADAVVDADGNAAVQWTVGLVPVKAAIRASIDEYPVFVDHTVQINSGVALVPVQFGDIDAMMATAGITGSTEGLTFDDSGSLYLAAKDTLFKMAADGTTEMVAVTGDGLNAPLGMAWDYLRHEIWIADTASIKRVTPAGVATTVATTDGNGALVTPNSVAINDNKYVYATDSCTGYVFRIDVETTAVEKVAKFDQGTQGGPNGLAFDASGQLYVTTENVGLLCVDLGLDMSANVAGLYKLDVSGSLPVTPVPLVANFAMFGDGLAFDVDGNLHVIFDQFDGFTLMESAVWIFPNGGATDYVKYISVSDRLLANMAWGWDDFGNANVYFSLLKVPMTTEARGAMKVETGISGMSLLPADLPE